jgi:hypothetical protein
MMPRETWQFTTMIFQVVDGLTAYGQPKPQPGNDVYSTGGLISWAP